MRTPLLPRALLVQSLLLLLGSGHYAAGLDLNDTTSGKIPAFSGHHNATGLVVSAGSEVSTISEMPSGSELSTGDYDYSEEYDNEPQISGYVIDDSVRVEQVIKPKKNKTEGDRTSDKPKRKKKGSKSGKGRRNKKKKKNPCDTNFQNFCIHGECVYIENLAVTCKCDSEYFGERCGEKSMKTQSKDDNDLSKIALAAITVFVSVVTLIAVGIVVTVQLRKRYFKEYEGEAEERKKLRQETGNVPVIA
ncbi:amphiregulin isoform X1 [Cricetulus griseus]|uniref:Amphiregulin n=1 Tax=Cricetulus griseus TaxID=10029 RepID=A0A061IPZ7_CRIGR|nr:amphiregulin isoform X2 [Cricetulus griseus]XP_035292722.1 amphiregulin isoform X1 [Cricetulus griseus]ERE90855.1 amphiregulin-like protein [Cricetulus griseus]